MSKEELQLLHSLVYVATNYTDEYNNRNYGNADEWLFRLRQLAEKVKEADLDSRSKYE